MRCSGAILTLGSLWILLGSAPLAGADDGAPASGAPTGLEIAQKVNARDEGGSLTRKVTMELIDKRGFERTRVSRHYRKYFGEEKKTIFVFESPKNIKDTAFLTIDYAASDRDDDQWLYLPALRRARRIAASDRGAYFMGTDLTYEDVKKETKLGIEDYRWTQRGEAVVDEHPCWVVEAVPVNEEISRELGYSRVEFRVDREIGIVREASYFGRSESALKTSRILDIRKVDGIWTPHRVEVQNHESGHRSNFTFEEIDYETEIEDDLFTERRLRQGVR